MISVFLRLVSVRLEALQGEVKGAVNGEKKFLKKKVLSF